MNKHLVVVTGPTAIGKTECGIHLARHFQTEIISADSRQIYRETAIGTAVPSREELEQAKHHFIQTIPVEQYYNASLYEFEVLDLLNTLFQKVDLVLMVGGSGLYIDAVCSGIDDLPAVDRDIRESLAEQYRNKGLNALTKTLKKLDPASYEKVDLKNPLRILKALEVSIQTGQPYSTFLKNERKKRDFGIIRLALDMEREQLYSRINSRVERMMETGLLDEVRKLSPLRNCTALKSVGYRELFQFLDGTVRLEDAVDQIKGNTRKYARKQMTWFRKDNLYRWFHPADVQGMIAWVESEINKSIK
ncbi:MAG: tRNA (adenosine(37)-N6)-dimethylallyltransferase MiaA [Bacteroidales bacterium]|nr:tRNA (adenosine(37)-N6)-dimethylallyltransferase MiaA [Bacteroidales bacterium]MBN2697743.1 tRNA (adenosine(37)-N6)-dimethylallyltransferase MiaA [Bacteroidales bacterium]